MSLLRRGRLMRRAFAALERFASNVGLIREASKEMRLFSHEVTAPAAAWDGRAARSACLQLGACCLPTAARLARRLCSPAPRRRR